MHITLDDAAPEGRAPRQAAAERLAAIRTDLDFGEREAPERMMSALAHLSSPNVFAALLDRRITDSDAMLRDTLRRAAEGAAAFAYPSEVLDLIAAVTVLAMRHPTIPTQAARRRTVTP